MKRRSLTALEAHWGAAFDMPILAFGCIAALTSVHSTVPAVLRRFCSDIVCRHAAFRSSLFVVLSSSH